ncbi:MAG: SCO family protein [Acidimicrobiia bacterium]
MIDSASSADAAATGRTGRRSVALLCAVAAILVAGVGLRLTSSQTSLDATSPSPYAGVLLDEPLPRPEFTLRDTSGRRFDFARETSGRLTLLFFGYTSCRDFCPMQLAMLSQVLERPGAPKAEVVFVGIDAERDIPEVVRAYLDRYDRDFIGLTGTPEELEAAQRAAGVPPGVAQATPPGEDVVIGHGTQIIAYTRDDFAHVVYPYGLRQQDWVSDLERLATVDGQPADASQSGEGQS